MPTPGALAPNLDHAPRSARDAALARELGTTRTVARVLSARGLGDATEAARFLEPKLAHLTPPEGMADRAVAAARLAAAARRGEHVCVFGDYDCDGMTANAILTEVLRLCGARVTPLVASRFDGGYGVSSAAMRRIAETGATLLVTCDCGSTDHDALATLGAQGLEVIVIDHHVVPERPLPVLAFLNPHRPECRFPYAGLASCGLALSMAAALRAELKLAIDVRQWLDLVAIGTIADVAPLDGDNRALVRAGLERLRHPVRPGLRALTELAGLHGDLPVTSEDVAFRLAPRLNAPGRLGAPDAALELLLARDPAMARGLAAQLEQDTQERRRQQDEMIAEALAEVATAGWRDRAGLVLGRRGWNHGVVGIVAGRLAAELTRPVAVIGFDASGHGRGSVRGPRGSRLYDVLEAASGALERFGGHQAAAGLEVREDRLEELRASFEQACVTHAARAEAVAAPFPFERGESAERIVADLERLEPFGEGNPAPRFVVDGRVLAARAVKGGHLKLELDLGGGQRLAGFAVGLADRAESLTGVVRVTGTLRRDRWRGGDAVEIGVESLDA